MSGNRCKTPMIYQMEATECGAASFAMICAYWGKHVPLEQMRIETGVSRDGCSGGDIMRAAKRMGLRCRARRKTAESLWDTPMPGPMMLLWGNNHFVVLEGFDRGCALINDPEVGRRRLGFEEFAAGYSGVVMGFEPTPEFAPAPRESRTMPQLKQRLSRMTGSIALTVALGLLVALPGVAIALMVGAFVDSLPDAGLPAGIDLGTFLLLLLALVALRLVLSLYRAQVMAKARFRFAKLSSNEFLQQVFRLPLGFFEMRFPGDVVTRIERNDATGAFLGGEAAEAMLDATASFVCLIALLLLCPPLAALACGIALLAVAASWLLMLATREAAAKGRQDKGYLLGMMCAGMDAIESLQVAGAQQVYADHVLELQAQAEQGERRANRLYAIARILPQAFDVLGTTVLLVVGALVAVPDGLSAGTLFAVVLMFGLLFAPVESFVGNSRRLTQLKSDLERIDDVFQMPADPWVDTADQQASARLSGAADAEAITFGYTAFSAPVVQDASLTLAPGEMVALVGASGSGKSTFTKLLAGLYHPREGSVAYDGKTRSEIAADTFHASLAVVGQECALFAGSVRDNITLWNPAVLEADMIRAAQDACIHETIVCLPGGYDHHVVSGGGNLSGGQRQRLEIARALATNPSLLVLDEATSGLDAPTERAVLANIRRRGCACIVVAHREEAMRACDRIVVMDAGSVVEQGTHDELLAAGGRYARLVARMRG